MENKIKRFLVIIGLILINGLAACESQRTATNIPTITPTNLTSVLLTSIPPQEKASWTQTMTQLSNNANLPIAGGWNLGRSLSKLENEKKITLGFLGGSITQGVAATATTSFSALVTSWFERQFPSAEIKGINVGASDTGSNYGAFRANHEVGKADLVFIEFAVNDQTLESASRDRIMNYTEGIVRRLYLVNPNVEIVFVDLVSQGIATAVYKKNAIPLVNQWHREIANHYTIPGFNSVLYIDPGQDMTNYINQGKATWVGDENPMTADGTHPNITGHSFIADKIIAALQKALLKSAPLPPFKPLPAPISPNPVQNGRMIDINKGQYSSDSWDNKVPDEYILRFAKSQLDATMIGATLDFTFSDSNYIGIGIMRVLKGGSFDAWVDDGAKRSFSTLGAFRRRGIAMVSENVGSGNHTLHIRVTSLPVTFTSFMISPP